MELLKQGKVRDIFFNKGFPEYLLIYHSDRLSSFDSNICDIDGKGKQPIFVVITDEKAKYQIFLDVLDQLKLAECRKVSVVES